MSIISSAVSTIAAAVARKPRSPGPVKLPDGSFYDAEADRKIVASEAGYRAERDEAHAAWKRAKEQLDRGEITVRAYELAAMKSQDATRRLNSVAQARQRLWGNIEHHMPELAARRRAFLTRKGTLIHEQASFRKTIDELEQQLSLNEKELERVKPTIAAALREQGRSNEEHRYQLDKHLRPLESRISELQAQRDDVRDRLADIDAAIEEQMQERERLVEAAIGG